MKAPLRAATKEAEKLRNWLAAELEPHEICNIDQYAHHVVTIFLNEDLDIEDEPLSPVGDFLTDIYSLRSGKSLDRKKRAAVQFLKSVISCENPVETEILQIIDELISRIEASKDSKPSSRKLLGPLTLNVASSGYRQSTKRNRLEQERRYNEAFPSLPGETERDNQAVSLVSCRCASSDHWQKSPINKENSVKNGRQSKGTLAAARSITFTDRNEAEACFTASLVFSLAIPDAGSFPSPHTMEVAPTAVDFSQNTFDGFWRSAFFPLNPTKLFSPRTDLLPSHENAFRFAPTVKKPLVVVGSSLSFSDHLPSYRTLQNYVNLFDPYNPKIFLHPEKQVSSHRVAPEMVFARDASDLEVANTIAWALINGNQKRKHARRGGKGEGKTKVVQKSKRIEDNEVKASVSQSLHCCEPKNDRGNNGVLDVANFNLIPPAEAYGEIDDGSSPLMGAVGGIPSSYETFGGHENVIKGNAFGFALQFEQNHDESENIQGHHSNNGIAEFHLNYGQLEGSFSHSKIQEFATPQWNQVSVELDTSGKTCTPDHGREKLHSIDSGMYAGGDDDSEAKAPSFSLKDLSCHNDESTPCFGSSDTAQAAWRRTPGRCSRGDELKSCTESTLSGGGNDSPISRIDLMMDTNNIGEDVDNTGGWNGLTNPSSDFSWDSMIQLDLFHDVPQRDTSIFHSPTPPTTVSNLLNSAFVNAMFGSLPMEPNHHMLVEIPHDPWNEVDGEISHNPTHQLNFGIPSDPWGPFNESSVEPTNPIHRELSLEHEEHINEFPQAVNCSDLEQTWLSLPIQESSRANQTRQDLWDVVKGMTCSNWLENNCNLGDACPFSHPCI